MEFLIILTSFTLLNAVSSFDSFQEQWNTYKTIYHKEYDQTEELQRLQNYITNMEYIKEHNKLYELGKVTYKMGINQFSDITKEEFTSTFLKPFSPNKNQNVTTMNFPKTELPDAIDWREKGAVTPVQFQSQCGSCGYGVTGSLEGQYFLNTSQLVLLSEEYFRRCGNIFTDCTGCVSQEIFQFVIGNGICAENSYEDNIDCNDIPILFKISKFVKIQEGNEKDLTTAVATIGPVQIAVDASYIQFYTSGIYYDEQCSSTTINHEVLVVGYGEDNNGMEYWIVKNSWGTTWGEDGYIKIARNQDNQCGIATDANYPVI